MRLFNEIAATSHAPLTGGPFTVAIQVRFKKSAKTAQTRLKTRTLDRKLDRIAFHYRRLSLVLGLHSLVSERKRGPFVSLNLLSRWAQHAGIKTRIAGDFRTSLRKILSMSVNGRIHIQAIRLMRRELGFPSNFRDLIIQKHNKLFRMVDLEIIELVDSNERGETLHYTAEVEKWREKRYIEKWLSAFETKYAFTIDFPTGLKIVAGFKEKTRTGRGSPT